MRQTKLQSFFIYLIFAFLLIFCGTFQLNGEIFNEKLNIVNLDDNNIALDFHFTFLKPNQTTFNADSYLFPKTTEEIIHTHHLNRLHLSMSKGFWDSDRWGPNFHDVPSGSTEVWATFLETVEKVDDQWDLLLNELSGLFGASLNNLGVSDKFSRPKFAFPIENNSRSNIRYAQSPAEPVCTENLTPWIKLLPCRRKAGLAQLLNPHRLFASKFHVIGLDLARKCASSTEKERSNKSSNCPAHNYELSMFLTVVMDRQLMSGLQKIALDELVDAKLSQACNLAASSQIRLFGWNTKLSHSPTPHHTKLITMQSSAFSNVMKQRHIQLASYNVLKMNKKEFATEITFYWTSSATANSDKNSLLNDANQQLSQSLISIEKYSITSVVGQSPNGIRVDLLNNGAQSIKIMYFEAIMWFFDIQISTLTIYRNQQGKLVHVTPEKFAFVPSLSRTRMAQLELQLEIPAKSHISIQYNFRKKLQRWSEFPPDANHGIAMQPSAVTFQVEDFATSPAAANWRDLIGQCHNNSVSCSVNQRRPIRMYSESVLINLPTPDFSMLFNVLCMVCSMLAVGFGPIQKFACSTLSCKLVATGEQKQTTIREKIKTLLSRNQKPLETSAVKSATLYPTESGAAQ